MVMDVNLTYYGDQFITYIYINIESLFYIPETYTMLYVNYISILKI